MRLWNPHRAPPHPPPLQPTVAPSQGYRAAADPTADPLGATLAIPSHGPQRTPDRLCLLYSQRLGKPDPGGSLGNVCQPLCQRSLPEQPRERGGAQTSLVPAPCNNHAPRRQSSSPTAVMTVTIPNCHFLGDYPVPGTGNTPPAAALGSNHKPTLLRRKPRYSKVRCLVPAAPKG